MFGPSCFKVIKCCFRAIAVPAELFGDPFLDLDFAKCRFRAIAVLVALFGGPFLDLDFSKYCFRAIAMPAALFGGPFLVFVLPKHCFGAMQERHFLGHFLKYPHFLIFNLRAELQLEFWPPNPHFLIYDHTSIQPLQVHIFVLEGSLSYSKKS